METLKNVALILYMLAKRVLKFADAYFALFAINMGAKTFQFEYIFQKFNKVEGLIYMVGFRVIFGFLLLLIYDFIGRDLFEFGKEIPREERLTKRKSFFQKIYLKMPWLEKIVASFIATIFRSAFLNTMIQSKWSRRLASLLFTISLYFIEPIFVVINSRDNVNKFNGIKSFKVLINYLVSSTLCSLALYATFSALINIF